MKLVPSIFPIYSFPTTFITDLSNYSLLIDQPPLVSIAVYFSSYKCLKYLSEKGASFIDTDDFGVFY